MKRMLVDLREPAESRVAVMNGGALEEIYIERAGRPTLVGNVYKGKVVNIEPGIQAAFVEIGQQIKGFLHASDVARPALQGWAGGEPSPDAPRKKAIQSLLRKGMEIPVQVTKDGVGKKGPALTTQISLPGRYLVLMPFLPKHGVSRKIEDDEERARLKELLISLAPPEDLGFIVRTAGRERRKSDLQGDLKYLLRLWEALGERMKDVPAPALLYQETDLLVRTIRDVFTSDVEAVLVDTEEGACRAREFFRVAMPRYVTRVHQYDHGEPIFQRYGAEGELAKIFERRVPLSTGGSIILEPTEAMVTVDVNSGRFTEGKDAEQTALKTNLEAAREIARQLRLRDLGGLIVVDFIDMRQEKNRREVEKAFRDALKADRARLTVLRMSRFCLVEMTRQRLRSSLSITHYDRCALCHGTGFRLNAETLAARVLRKVRFAAHAQGVVAVEVRAHPDVALHLLNQNRPVLADVETSSGREIRVVPAEVDLEAFEVLPLGDRGKVLRI